MRLAELVQGLGLRGEVPPELRVDALTVDDREVRPGTLYVARRGYYGDGHDRIALAMAAGAGALVVSRREAVGPGSPIPVLEYDDGACPLGPLSSRIYREPTHGLAVYGVTGTNGKTSVTYLLEHILAALGERPAVLGTISYRFGGHELPAVNTTPDVVFVHRFARQVLDAGARSLVLEVSSHALALGRVDSVRFERVGFTNLSHEHLDFHGTMEEYERVKARLFSRCLESARKDGRPALAAACVAHPAGRRMLAATAPEVTRLSVAVGNADPSVAAAGAAHIQPLEPLGVAGTRFRLRIGDAAWEGTTRLVGHHNLENVALAVALAAGTDPDRARAAVACLESFHGIPGRLERVSPRLHAGRAVFVDYAHTPDAVGRALSALSEMGARPVTIVLGCGGDRDPSKRAPMAMAAVRGADRVVLTSDNPRSEDPAAIVAQMTDVDPTVAMPAEGPLLSIELDRERAIELAVCEPGSVTVLVAGKGHEPYQEREGTRHSFDDREHARRALAALEANASPADLPLWSGWTAARIARATGAVSAPEALPYGAFPKLRLKFVALADGGGASPVRRSIELYASAACESRTVGNELQCTLLVAEPAAAVARLARAAVAEASTSPGGLWIAAPDALRPSDTVEALAPRASSALLRLALEPKAPLPHEDADRLPSSAGGEGLLGAVRVMRPTTTANGSWRWPLEVLACLDARARGLVLLPPEPADLARCPCDSDPLRGLPDWLSPTVLLTDGSSAGAGRTADAGGLFGRARASTRRRFAHALAPRPIPVPEGSWPPPRRP